MLAKKLQSAVAGQVAGGYTIERSLRFNSADSAYLNRTPGSAGNRKTWTISCWLKRSNNTNYPPVIGMGGGNNYLVFWFRTDGELQIQEYNSGINWEIFPSARYRDFSSWMHLVLAFDSTQATSTNRLKLYVNGVQITTTDYLTYPSQNYDSFINSTTQCNIGSYGSYYYNGYIADFNLIDGQALTPADFGEYNADTGVWQPIAYAGTYGTNGFHLDFSDNTSTTTIGYDSSGNGNNWTANNFSVTAGAGNDSFVDTPTPYGTDTGAGGEVGGNYATLNPLAATDGTFSNGNLEYVGNNNWKATGATILLPNTGKWYAEVTLLNGPFGSTFGNQYNDFGLIAPTSIAGWGPVSGTSFFVTDTGHYSNYSGGSTGQFTIPVSGTVLGLAVDRDANTVTIYRDGVAVASNITLGITSGADLVFFRGSYNGSYGNMAHNFGQRPFAYTAPSGFKALCTTNLPEPDVVQGDTAFNTVIYTGTGSARSVTGVGFQPDFVWTKSRSNAYDNALYDSVRGTTKELVSNSSGAEATYSTGLTSFDSDGFTLGSAAWMNGSGATFVGWSWKAGGSGVSNTDGSITSTVSANPTAGISVVTYTGTGSTGGTVGHGLAAAPSLIFVKTRSIGYDWIVYSSILGKDKYLTLNTSAAEASASNIWGTASPTSSVFGVYASNGANNNALSQTHVAYCFAPVEGFSAFGSYTGNGSTNGPFVYTGFRPAFILTKETNSSSYWWEMVDAARSPYNVSNKTLYANVSDSEYTASGYDKDLLSNGFKVRGTNGGQNASGSTYIYMAFASNPFKYSLGA